MLSSRITRLPCQRMACQAYSTTAPAFAKTPTTEVKNPKFSKQHIVAEIAETHDMTKVKAGKIYATIMASIEEKLAGGQIVYLHNFGSFERVYAKERNGVNPSTSEKIVIPAKQRIRFKTATHLKKRINEN